jgi:hypothetical protein
MADRSLRNLFLSHRSVDKDFVRRLAADIEAITFQGEERNQPIEWGRKRPRESEREAQQAPARNALRSVC